MQGPFYFVVIIAVRVTSMGHIYGVEMHIYNIYIYIYIYIYICKAHSTLS